MEKLYQKPFDLLNRGIIAKSCAEKNTKKNQFYENVNEHLTKLTSYHTSYTLKPNPDVRGFVCYNLPFIRILTSKTRFLN